MEDLDILTTDGISPMPSAAGQPTALPSQDLPADEPSPTPERSRTVPYGALAEERTRRKELQRELQESASTRQRLQDRLDALHALANQAEPEVPQAAPSLDEGPAPEIEQVTAKGMAASADGVFRTQVLQSVRSYAAERPDFLDAYQHARQARVEELTALGYAQDEALAITFENEREVINSAFAAGRNPARVIYDFAIGRGYRPAAESQSAPVRHRNTSTGLSGGVTAMTEAEKIALAARGQAAAKSLSAAGGGSTGTLTLEALAGMTDEEFAEATKGDRWHRLLRG